MICGWRQKRWLSGSSGSVETSTFPATSHVYKSLQSPNNSFCNPQNFINKIIEDWLRTCSELHPKLCTPVKSANLENILLIDVNTRQLIPYSSLTPDYIALSYVWGGVSQKYPGAGKVGRTLGALGQTIEDAITVTKNLGIHYLWVDSLCIDQSNESTKFEQIQTMGDIYQGAYATLIAVRHFFHLWFIASHLLEEFKDLTAKMCSRRS